MSHRMLGFVDTDQATPEKREADARRKDFDEIYRDYAKAKAEEQAARCSQCGVPFCQVHCPLGNNIPDWLRLTAEGRLQEAYEVSSATNTFPEICGRICPQDRLCEGLCTIEQSGHGTVTIGAIERHITETAFQQGWVTPRMPPRERDQSVGIIGAGPAGLAAAEALRARGYQVTVYDRYDRSGGLMIYGIPGFKLEKDVVQRREALLREQGVAFQLNTDIGTDITFKALRVKHDALLIATGVYKARDLTIPGSDAANIVPALDYLTASNRTGLGDVVADFDSGLLNAAGKRVVVIGGGDTAMDCVRTAVRQGATSVQCLYRRDRANMPGSKRETANAEEEGVEFVWLSAPDAFEVQDGAVKGVRAAKMRLGAADASGRREPRRIPGGESLFEADLVIKALGFLPEDLPKMFGEEELAISRSGTLVVDPNTLMTSLPGVFAAGDIVRGASLVVWGIRDGRDAATQMHTYLAAQARQAAAPAVAAE